MKKLTMKQIFELEEMENKRIKSGYVYIPRCIIYDGWYSVGHALGLFVHFLLTMSVNTFYFKGMTIEKGVCFTSMDDLVSDTGMTKKQIRKAVCALEKYHKISVSKYNAFLIIKVLDYSQYLRSGCPERLLN